MGLAYDTPVPTNWFEAFQQLKSVINASTLQKKVVLLDELSWMDTPKSSTMQAFEYFWNSWASARNDVLLILCSSASSWMLDKVVHDTGGLYHRLNRQIHLRPSPLTWCKCYADANQLGLSDSQIVELYMVLGGIPAYWSLLQRGHSVSQSLDLLFFDTKAPLAREHDLLLASPFRRPEPYRKIVGALSRRKKGLTRSEILEATGIADTGAFSKQLEHLESCGLIRAHKAFGKRKKDSLFQLMDPSILFHYRFLGSRPHDPHYWTHHLLHPAISSWRDLAFKQVCLLHVDEMKRKLGISGVFTKPSSFVCRADPELGTQGSQIDLVLWRADRVFNLFEMKYTDGLLTIDRSLDADLRRRASDFRMVTKCREAIHWTFVTPYGLVRNAYAGNVVSEVTCEDLFAKP